MKLTIDGMAISAKTGQTLLELTQELGFTDQTLSRRPLAAKIAGEVFTLIRRAMAASGGQIRLMRYSDEAGRETYSRTAQFILFLALRQLWPDAVSKMNCTVGSSVYIKVTGAEGFSVDKLKERVSSLIAQDIPLLRRRVPLETAKAHYLADGYRDKARMLQWRNVDYFDEYAYEDFVDYYSGEMMPSLGYLSVWDILPVPMDFFSSTPTTKIQIMLPDIWNLRTSSMCLRKVSSGAN